MGRVIMGDDRRGFGWRKLPKEAASVGHVVPRTPIPEGKKPHLLVWTGTERCWCDPIVEISGRQHQIVHRDIEPPDIESDE